MYARNLQPTVRHVGSTAANITVAQELRLVVSAVRLVEAIVSASWLVIFGSVIRHGIHSLTHKRRKAQKGETCRGWVVEVQSQMTKAVRFVSTTVR
jgi:hypothetical protein